MKKEEIYRLLAENMIDMVSQHNTDGSIEWISSSVTALLGYLPEELIGMNFYDLLQPTDRNYMLSYAHQLTLKEGYNENLRIEYRIRKKRGGYLWFESMTKPIHNEKREVVKLQITSRDISKRKIAENELLISKKRQELALAGADLGLWDLNLRSGKLVVNERWAEMLGYNVDEITPSFQGWLKLVHPDDVRTVNKGLRDHLQDNSKTYETEHRLKTKDGQWKWILSRGKVLEWDDDGRAFRAVGTHLDITANKKSENLIMKAIVDTEESERTRFATDLHDGIGQYLSAIRMHLDAIKSNLETSDYEICDQLIDIANSHIENTVGDLREITYNLMPGTLKDLGLVAALEELFDKVLGATSIELDYNSNFGEERFPTSVEINLYRICQQLLSNTLQHARAGKIKLHITKSDDALGLIYEDDGPGLPDHINLESTGNGLRNIEMRVRTLNGTLHFQTGGDFIAELQVPLTETEYATD